MRLLGRTEKWLALLPVLLVLMLPYGRASAGAAAGTLPVISNVQLANANVARYDKFQADFDVRTVSQYPNLPYDAHPPAGLQPGMGVSVDALFSQDNWKTTIVQPAFWFQPFTRTVQDGRDHYDPDGAPHWQVRFAPQTSGNWQMRLRATDAGGTSTYPATGGIPFTVNDADGSRYSGLRQNPSSAHGFLRVSQTDPRYFEFQDGTPFLGLGYSPSVGTVDKLDARFRDWQLNGLEFARVWMSMGGINGSQWSPWGFPKQFFDGSTPAQRLDRWVHLPGAQLSFRLDHYVPCLFADFWQGGIPVQPSTTYSVSVQAKLDGLTAAPNSPNAGLAVLRGPFPNSQCPSSQTPSVIQPRLGSTDWYTATGTLTTGPKQYWLDYLYVSMQDVITGTAYFDNLSLVAQGDPNQVNLLRRGSANMHYYFDSMSAARWDELIRAAETHGVFLKLVTDEKSEWIRNVIQSDGTMALKPDQNNYYAAPNTEVRWLDQAWWRYLIARWGYSTAIHSFEFINEGDPYNGNHYNIVQAMADYIHRNDPSRHMVTTSFWHSFPNKEFWSNPAYSAVDYADLHAYILTGWGNTASFIPQANLETRPEFIQSGNASFHIPGNKDLRQAITPRGVTLNEKGEWTIRFQMKAQDLNSTCATANSTKVGIVWELGSFGKPGTTTGKVPAIPQGQPADCGSPGGTFNWQQFDSAHDRNGKPLASSQRLIVNDDKPHELTLYVSNFGGKSGDAWIDDVELISPSGVKVPVIGQFDNTPFDKDTAWLTAAYSLLWGGNSPVGAHKPLVRGETGINSQQYPNGIPDVNQDRDGVWLHDMVWGLINPGGMYDLYWWGKESIEGNPQAGRADNLFRQYLTFAAFMQDVPLNNGHYRDAAAQTSTPDLRAWGQRDDVNGRAILWIQNRQATWDRFVRGETVEPADGTVTLANMPAGTYRVEWWDTWQTSNPVLKTEQIQAQNGTLTLQLPAALDKDIAVKLARLP